MKRHIAILATAASMLLLDPSRPLAAEVEYHAPRTDAATRATDLLERGSQAISELLSGCSDHDLQRLNSAVTGDAMIEYPLADVGTYLMVDVSVFEESCRSGGSGRVTELWTFPANDSDSLFIEYGVESDVSSIDEKTDKHLVLLTMNGDRIRRMRDFTTVAKVRDATCR